MTNRYRPEEHYLGQYIPLHYHYNLLLDEDRMSSFRSAIEYLTAPGSAVLELGGGTGVLSHFAAKNARRVWCVERNPELAAASRRFLSQNEFGNRVEVVQDDARNYLPPEPIDVVICEMLHTALAREKQIEVLDSFQRRYVEKFGLPLPRFIPEASLLAIQPVEQPFDFSGYRAPIPFFQLPGNQETSTRSLCQPVVYAAVEYDRPLPHRFDFQADFSIERAGCLNAVRFITKNLLAFQESAGSAIEWSNQFFVAPLAEPIVMEAGQIVTIKLGYQAGCKLTDLIQAVEVRRANHWDEYGQSRRAA